MTKKKENDEMPEDGTAAFPGEEILLQQTAASVLKEYLDHISPELTENNPVLHWAIADDHVSFIFRDGRKVLIVIKK